MCAHTSMFLILHTPHLFHSKDSGVRFGENIQIHSQSSKYVKISKHSYENSYKNWKIYTIKPDKSNGLLVLMFLIVTAPHSGQMDPSRSRLSAAQGEPVIRLYMEWSLRHAQTCRGQKGFFFLTFPNKSLNFKEFFH